MMGWRPEIMQAISNLVRVVLGTGEVERGLKQLVAQVASTTAGCRYCQAHTATGAAHAGVSPEKIAAVYEFEESPLFSEAELAALRLARDAALVPNAVTRGHFDAMREHYTEPEIVELVATISLFGFLNRWNDSFATELEGVPLAFAQEHLRAAGWEPGKHQT